MGFESQETKRNIYKLRNMVMKKTVFVYDYTSNNVGDINSCPLDYFDFSFTENIKANLKDMREDDRSKYYLDNVIFGGGGLISGRIKKMFRMLLADKPANCKVFSWGIGHNEKRRGVRYHRKNIRNFIEVFDTLSVRDWGTPHLYVPCVSCMHKVFDVVRPKPKHKIVIYDHYGYEIPSTKNFPRMNNLGVTIEEVADFLSSGTLVVTSAYHGVYWALLLGKKVLIIPWASRFHGFRYKSLMSTLENWQFSIDKAMGQEPYPQYLQESRDINIKYYDKVRNMMNK